MKKIDPKKFSKSKTDKAGKVLAKDGDYDEKKFDAIDVLDNWRAAHSYPMHIFKMRLKKVSEKIDDEAISVQRLKRVPSILKKLTREYEGRKATMNLTQMQDIAGCRTVMSNLELANKLYEDEYLNSDLKHKKVNEKNYNLNPKSDGYRGIHLVYKYHSDKNKEDFNGLLVEIQIRSKIQHIWATSVETVDFFTKQAIKSNEGEYDWVFFFKLVSSAFAKLEGCPIIEGTPYDEKELYLKIKEFEKKLNVITRLEKWGSSLKYFEKISDKHNSKFFLLQLDTIQDTLNITSYKKNQEEFALKDYAIAEKKVINRDEYDIVLVGVDNLKDLKSAYPNYFIDTREFLKYLKIFINKY
ncbi:MAG: RelA/SpoT domain-containing protein [Nanoarchaeales archaeon]|nr:RelA/SpoT domain-containing protein [Nanoarchaeales archaeon]